MHKAKVHTELQKNVSFKDTKEAYYNCQQFTKHFNEKDGFESHTKYCHLKEGTKALKKLKKKWMKDQTMKRRSASPTKLRRKMLAMLR